MAGLSSIGGVSAVNFSAQYGARVAVLQKNALEQQGDMALKLIQSASLDTGRSLDISG